MFSKAVLQALLFSSAVVAQVPATSLEECVDAAGVPNAFSSDAGFPAAISPWQLRIQPTPAGVAFPTTTPQVVAALKCAVDRKIKVTAKVGGHSYGSYGVGGTLDGVFVVNLLSFNKTVYNPSTKLFTYGGGSLVGPTLTWLWNNHQRHFPHVRANFVGLPGSTIGAGFGSTARLLGTPLDNVESYEYLLWNGSIVTASRSQNKDLFWAASGAGSSFGLILSVTTKTWAAPFPNAVSYTIDVGSVDIATGVNALLTIQKFVLDKKLPDTLSLRWSLTAPPFTGSGFYYGEPSTFNATIAPLIAALPAGTRVTSSVLPFWEIEKLTTPNIDGPTNTFPPRNFYLQALVVRSDKPLTYASTFALYNSTTYAFNRTDLTKFGFIDLWGGKIIRETEDSEYSYAQRNNLWIVRWEGRLAAGLTTFPADGISYLRNQLKPFENQLKKEGTPLRGFVNYRDTELTVPEWSARLYANNWNKLLKIKKVIDPLGIFTTNSQSIPVV